MLLQVRAEFAAYESDKGTVGGYVRLKSALEQSEEILSGNATSAEKQTVLNMVHLHAERLKREAEHILENYLAASRESLALVFEKMALFGEYDVGLSEEFFKVLTSTELATLFRKHISEWDNNDFEHLYRLVPSWRPKS